MPLALETPNVFVTRTFSKAYGMAGMRIGYAIGRAETMKPLARLKMPYNVSVFGIAAAIAALADQGTSTTSARATRRFAPSRSRRSHDLGCKTADSQGNFLFADVGRPAKEFRDACAKQGVVVGRDFPPFEKTHVRISIGTMEEMQKAIAVFRSVAAEPVSTSTGEHASRRSHGADATRVRSDGRNWRGRCVDQRVDRRPRSRERALVGRRAGASGGRARRDRPRQQREPARPGADGDGRRQGGVWRGRRARRADIPEARAI